MSNSPMYYRKQSRIAIVFCAVATILIIATMKCSLWAVETPELTVGQYEVVSPGQCIGISVSKGVQLIVHDMGEQETDAVVPIVMKVTNDSTQRLIVAEIISVSCSCVDASFGPRDIQIGVAESFSLRVRMPSTKGPFGQFVQMKIGEMTFRIELKATIKKMIGLPENEFSAVRLTHPDFSDMRVDGVSANVRVFIDRKLDQQEYLILNAEPFALEVTEISRSNALTSTDITLRIVATPRSPLGSIRVALVTVGGNVTNAAVVPVRIAPVPAAAATFFYGGTARNPSSENHGWSLVQEDVDALAPGRPRGALSGARLPGYSAVQVSAPNGKVYTLLQIRSLTYHGL